MEERQRALNSVAFPSATVQIESTADGDAAVFILHIQPQLTSAPSLKNCSWRNVYAQQSECITRS